MNLSLIFHDFRNNVYFLLFWNIMLSLLYLGIFTPNFKSYGETIKYLCFGHLVAYSGIAVNHLCCKFCPKQWANLTLRFWELDISQEWTAKEVFAIIENEHPQLPNSHIRCQKVIYNIRGKALTFLCQP